MPPKPKIVFNPRELMLRAIAEMKKSVAEARPDGDVPPKVGAVIWKPDGSIETAYRGELRDGDHAEFTLLERKNRMHALDGCILFATLEPCAPGARKHPKLGCAERIVNARIREVWVGIQDPHTKVGGKGFVYLDKHGVTVHWFDRDLQDIIKQENAAFLRRAEMLAEEEDRHEVVSVPELEKVNPDARFDDLSEEALKEYRSFVDENPAGDPAGFNRLLLRQELVKKIKQELHPSGFATLLFGKRPRDEYPEAGLLATFHRPEGGEDIEDFDGPLVSLPGQIVEWLKTKLPNPIDRSEVRRKGANDKFYELVREGVVNALVHRDYGIKGAKCQMEVWPDYIVLKSPGRPIKPITIEQMRSFDAPMVSRNPILHVVFNRMEMAEERGLGLKSMKAQAAEIGLPLPTYDWQDPYLTLTLFRTAQSATATLSKPILDQLTAEEKQGWIYLAARDSVTQADYATHLEVTARTAQRHLTHFVDLKLLTRVGRGKATKYVKN